MRGDRGQRAGSHKYENGAGTRPAHHPVSYTHLLVDNYDEDLLNNPYNKSLTQTSSRPIRILCATKIHQSMMETLKENFDILLYVEDIKVTDQKESFSKLTKVITDESIDFVDWNNQLNHWRHDRYDEQMERISYQNYMKERQQKKLKSSRCV